VRSIDVEKGKNELKGESALLFDEKCAESLKFLKQLFFRDMIDFTFQCKVM
jgi:hypothetical protein